MKIYPDMAKLRSYSSVFSRSVFSEIIEYDDFNRLNTLFNRYDAERTEEETYLGYLKYIYHAIAKDYRCEYVYKNEIINKLLLNEYGTENTVVINEFRVQNSIVDMAMFNGESSAFEIKTEYDNNKRLNGQIQDYTKLFQKCYLVIPEQIQDQYKRILDANVGIIVLSTTSKGKLTLKKARPAIKNKIIDVDVLMRCVRTIEYKNIVLKHFGKLPDVSCYEMYEKCQEKIMQIPKKILQQLFIEEIKKRKNNTQVLERFLHEIRQICLSLNLTYTQYTSLLEKLNNPIIV